MVQPWFAIALLIQDQRDGGRARGPTFEKSLSRETCSLQARRPSRRRAVAVRMLLEPSSVATEGHGQERRAQAPPLTGAA